MDNITNPAGKPLASPVRSSLLTLGGTQNAMLIEAANSAMQKLARIQQQAARAEQRKLAALTRLAQKAGVHHAALTDNQLFGAMLLITGNAQDAGALASYEAAADAFLKARSNATGEVTYNVHVSADTIGTELKAECRSLGLRSIAVPPGFNGKLRYTDALALGETYAATVGILWNDEQKMLVENGKVNAEVAGLFVDPATAAREDSPASIDAKAATPNANPPVEAIREQGGGPTLAAERRPGQTAPAQSPSRPFHPRPGRVA